MENIEDLIGPDEIRCCPICDNPIQEEEPVSIVCAYGFKNLAHEICVDNYH